MNLSLRGSQINLATRSEPPSICGSNRQQNLAAGASSKYRPRSANVIGSHSRNKKNSLLRRQTEGKRPLSADSKVEDASASLSGSTIATKKKYTTSTNLLNLLSSEDQSTDQWDSTTDIECKSSGIDKKLKNIKSKMSVVTTKDDNKSKVKKDNYDNHSLIKSCNEKHNESETSSESPSSSSLTNNRYAKKSQNTKSDETKIVTTNKGILKSEIKSDDKDQSSYQSWVMKNIKTPNNKSMDLPGRVSFSTNDVYEIVDYSDGDYEDTDKSLSDSPKMTAPPRPSTATSQALNNLQHRDLYSSVASTVTARVTENYLHGMGVEEIDTDETLTDEIDAKCCNSSRCSLTYDSNLAKARMESKAREEANKIVEEYKKELHELRTIHLQNPYSATKSRASDDFGDYFSDSPYKTDIYATRKDSPSSISSVSKTSSSMNNEITKRPVFDDMKLDAKMDDLTSNDSPIPKDDANKVLAVRLNNVWEKENTIKTNTAFSIKHSNSNAADSAGTTNNVTFKNYLKNKNSAEDNRLLPPKQMKKLNDLQTGTTTSSNKKKQKDTKPPKMTSNRIKSAPISTSSKMRKTKSVPALREDRGIDEFEIDKVVSWMSIHDSDAFSDTASLLGGTNNTSDTKSLNLRTNAWQKATGRSEDEGNYSTEDGLDTDSPYEEIVSVIKEIEDEKGNKGEFQSLKTDVEFKLNTILNTIESPDSAMISDDDKMTTTSKESSKVSEILHYLDEVDTKCEKTLQNIRKTSNGRITGDDATSEMEFIFEPDSTDDIPKVSELLMLTNHQLCRKIVNLSLRVNELNNAIQLSKEHVSNVRAEKMKTVRLEKQNTQKRLNEQKKHYEDIVQRHQTFIEQLLKDKANLCEKVNAATRRLDSQNQAWEHKLKTEIERAKETVMAGEKLRRERWVRDNTKKIKELTVKGLEMEINKMQTQHQKEIADLKKTHQKELIDSADELKQRFDEEERKIRESYAKDREAAIERERLAIVERFEKQLEDERKLFEQQKIRLIKEFEEEKQKIGQDIETQKSNYDASREKLKNESMDLLQHVKAEFKEKLKQKELKHQNDMKKLEEQFETDFSVWKREYETSMKLRECERENYIRQQSRAERDRQIESIIAKVDGEALKNQQEFEIKMNRVKEKYEREIAELEKQESETKEKYIESKGRLAECEANITNLQATVKQLDTQLTHFKKMCDDFMKEKENVRLEARKEIEKELKTLREGRDAEIQRIYSRVQKAIEKKDATLEALQKDNTRLKEQCLKLDAIVKQQRKDYVKK
ncbi:centrosomal protein of 131 kDa [Culicoides brevitarsis]|uniref:centrosomal protein of 131 kDa n=1 Tax=Culicoides brevitarsis TaxID=469753 RepID=UPI00307B9EB6